jgi:uncharacterized protein (TIGR03000 family)
MRTLGTAMTAVLTLALAAPRACHANVFGEDPREPITTSEYPWSTIGRVVTTKSGVECWGTGTLVGRNLVVTAAHCLIDPKTQALTGEPVMFYPNVRNRGAARESAVISVRLGTRDPKNHLSHDWAILELEKPLGDACGWLGIHATTIDTLPDQITVAGYSTNFQGGDAPSVHRDGKVRTRFRERGVVGHDCATGHGSSGGPVLGMRNGQLTVYGLNIASKRLHGESGESLTLAEYDPRRANIAIPSHEFVQKLREIPKPSLITIGVPVPGAQVWIGDDDASTTSTGRSRTFETAVLKEGKVYTYVIRAVWDEDGRRVTREKKVEFKAGERVNVEFE